MDAAVRRSDLVAWQQPHEKDGTFHPLLAVVFLEIHPVQDGNVRLSRTLTTLLVPRAGYAETEEASR